MPSLTCDPDTHIYRLDGQRLLGVTEILESAGIKPKSEYRNGTIDYAIQLGDYVHQATAMDDRGELDETELDEAIRPYLAAWRAWKAMYQPTFEAIEEPVAHEVDGYAGTPDRVAIIGGRRGVIELKSGHPEKWHKIQAEFYRQITETDDRHLVYLCADGTYEYEVWFPDVRHTDVYRAAVVIALWKRTRETK